MGKYKKCKSKKIKISFHDGMKSLNYLMDDILYIVKKDYFEYIVKTYETFTDTPSIRLYVNETENRITFKIKIRYYLQLLKFETIKLLESTKSKINKDKNDENELSLEITEVVLVHCDILNNHCKQDSRVLNIYVPNKSFGQLLYISPKLLCF